MPSRWQASPRSAKGVPCPLSPPRLPPREEVPSALCCSPVPPPFSLPAPEGLPGDVLLRRGTQAQTQARLPWLWGHQTRLPWVPSLFSASLCLPCQLSVSSFGGLIGGELPAWSPTTTPSLVPSTASPETRRARQAWPLAPDQRHMANIRPGMPGSGHPRMQTAYCPSHCSCGHADPYHSPAGSQGWPCLGFTLLDTLF